MDDKRDRQPYAEHNNKRTRYDRGGRIRNLEWVSERQDNQVHKSVDHNAVKQAADNNPLSKKPELAARKVEDGAPNKRDEKVQRAAQRSRSKTVLVGVRAEQPGGD